MYIDGAAVGSVEDSIDYAAGRIELGQLMLSRNYGMDGAIDDIVVRRYGAVLSAGSANALACPAAGGAPHWDK